MKKNPISEENVPGQVLEHGDYVLPGKGGDVTLASRSNTFNRVTAAKDYITRLMGPGRMGGDSPLFTGNTLPFGEVMDRSMDDMKSTKRAYFEAFESACAIHGLDPSGLVKHALGYADLLGLIPGGGVLEGAAVPETGASRGETLLFGGGGSVLGALLGGGLGGALTANVTPGAAGPQVEADPLAMLAGASLGSGAGNLLGRWLARHPQQPMDAAQIQDIIRQVQPGSNITINVADMVRRQKDDNDA